MKKVVQLRQIKGRSLTLRPPEAKDSGEFIEMTRSSAKFHKGLVTPPGDQRAFTDYIKRSRNGSDRCFLILRNEDQRIAGAINLSQIFYGGFKNAYLGYYLFEQFAGRGMMKEAIGLVLHFAFLDLKLHRLEANIQPHNAASIRLVEKCGFTNEGYSRNYLKIGGRWRDHMRWAIIKEDWKARKK
ncbi:MAG: GNAT family N-acetyltransferase [Acidobacteria bacterium]|nr:GNAT family N-acetyltransferase [Acidobacteriota bacterium]